MEMQLSFFRLMMMLSFCSVIFSSMVRNLNMISHSQIVNSHHGQTLNYTVGKGKYPHLNEKQERNWGLGNKAQHQESKSRQHQTREWLSNDHHHRRQKGGNAQTHSSDFVSMPPLGKHHQKQREFFSNQAAVTVSHVNHRNTTRPAKHWGLTSKPNRSNNVQQSNQ